MSYDTDRYLFYHMQSTALSLTECGIQICHAGHAAPPLKYHDYSMHFILEGKGVYEIGGKRFPLGAGEGFLIRPGDVCSYTADRENPWKYIYISFRGSQASELCENMKIGDPALFSFPNDENMQSDIYKMHAAGKKDAHQGFDALGYFLLAASRLIPQKARSGDKQDTDARHLLRAKRYMEDNFSYAIRIEDVAQHACIERSYLYRLFMRYEEISPLEYLTNLRLMHATELLSTTSLSITEIGCATGFFDGSHFSKSFLKKYGCTPGEYRKKQ